MSELVDLASIVCPSSGETCHYTNVCMTKQVMVRSGDRLLTDEFREAHPDAEEGLRDVEHLVDEQFCSEVIVDGLMAIAGDASRHEFVAGTAAHLVYFFMMRRAVSGD